MSSDCALNAGCLLERMAKLHSTPLKAPLTLSMRAFDKLGVLVLMLASRLAPALTCMVPDAEMNAQERACCRVMQRQCGQKEMLAVHAAKRVRSANVNIWISQDQSTKSAIHWPSIEHVRPKFVTKSEVSNEHFNFYHIHRYSDEQSPYVSKF